MTVDHFDQYATLNPVPDVDALPDTAWSDAMLLDAVDRKSAAESSAGSAPRSLWRRWSQPVTDNGPQAASMSGASSMSSTVRISRKGPLVAVAVMAAVLVLGLVTSLITASQPDTVGQSETTPATPPPQLRGDPSVWSWSVVDWPAVSFFTGGSGIGSDQRTVNDGRRFYHLAVENTILISADGLEWDQVAQLPATVPAPMGLYTGAGGVRKVIAASEGHLLVVFQAGESLAAHVVDPDGDVATGKLPTEDPGTSVSYASVEVLSAAVGPRGALIHTAVELDAEAIGRAAFGDLFDVYEESRDQGAEDYEDIFPEIRDGMVFVEGPGAKNVDSDPVPLADLGIDEEEVRGASRLWLSEDGASWQSVPVSDLFTRSGEDPIVGITDGFVLLNDGVWYSPDGHGWSELHSPGQISSGRLLPWRGQALIASEEGFWKATSEGVEQLALADAPPLGGDVAAGQAGIAYVHVGLQSDSVELVYSPDGHSWTSGTLPKEFFSTDNDWFHGWLWGWYVAPWVGENAILLEGAPAGSDGSTNLLRTTRDGS